jgi:hypothetical protein
MAEPDEKPDELTEASLLGEIWAVAFYVGRIIAIMLAVIGCLVPIFRWSVIGGVWVSCGLYTHAKEAERDAQQKADECECDGDGDCVEECSKEADTEKRAALFFEFVGSAYEIAPEDTVACPLERCPDSVRMESLGRCHSRQGQTL